MKYGKLGNTLAVVGLVLLLAGCSSTVQNDNSSASATAAKQANSKKDNGLMGWSAKNQRQLTEYLSSYAQVNGVDLLTATTKHPATFANQEWPAVYAKYEAKLGGKMVYLRSGKADANSDIYVVQATYALQAPGQEMPAAIYISALRRGAPVLFTVTVNTEHDAPFLQLTSGSTTQIMKALSTIGYGGKPERPARE